MPEEEATEQQPEEQKPVEEEAERQPMPQKAKVDEELSEGLSLEEDESLPFPNARVVKLLKEGLDSEKMVRGRVKHELNVWLGEMVKRVAKDMNKSPYTMVEAGDLHRAIRKYEQLEEVHKQKERIMVYLDKIKQDCNVLLSDVERSFDVS